MQLQLTKTVALSAGAMWMLPSGPLVEPSWIHFINETGAQLEPYGTLAVLSLVKSKPTMWLMIYWGRSRGQTTLSPTGPSCKKNLIYLECLSKMHIVGHL